MLETNEEAEDAFQYRKQTNTRSKHSDWEVNFLHFFKWEKKKWLEYQTS